MLQSVFSYKSQPLPGLQLDLTIKKSPGCPPPPPTKHTHKQFKKQNTGLSLRAAGRGFSPATKRVAPSYSYWKIEPKDIPSRLIPRLLVVFMGQLEILVTTLKTQKTKKEHATFLYSRYTIFLSSRY